MTTRWQQGSSSRVIEDAKAGKTLGPPEKPWRETGQVRDSGEPRGLGWTRAPPPLTTVKGAAASWLQPAATRSGHVPYRKSGVLIFLEKPETSFFVSFYFGLGNLCGHCVIYSRPCSASAWEALKNQFIFPEKCLYASSFYSSLLSVINDSSLALWETLFPLMLLFLLCYFKLLLDTGLCFLPNQCSPTAPVSQDPSEE